MLGVDVGGTFTDVVAIRDGRIQVTKVPSDRDRPAAAVVEGARRIGVKGSAVFNHASAMGINAVITRRLPKIAFLTTQGFRDMLDRGRVWRPLDGQTDRAGAARWRRVEPARSPLSAPGHRGADPCRRQVMTPLDEMQARKQLAVLERCAVEGVAICLLNSYVNPAHEHRLRELRGRCSAAFRSRSPLTPPRSPRSTPAPPPPSSTCS